jgi:hypothetical protein
MVNRVLKCAAVGILLLTPVSAYAGFGDPTPNAIGIAPRDGSASQSAIPQIEKAWWRGGWHRGWGWRGGWGWHRGWGWRGYGWRHCWRGYYGRLRCN